MNRATTYETMNYILVLFTTFYLLLEIGDTYTNRLKSSAFASAQPDSERDVRTTAGNFDT